MTNKYDKNITPESDDLNSSDFFKKTKAPFNRSKEDLWSELENRMDRYDSVKKSGIIRFMPVFYAAAAVLVIALAVSFYINYYQDSVDIINNEEEQVSANEVSNDTTISVGRGEHVICQLPDGSIVELNAESSLTYNPVTWNENRSVNLKGEAFFEVQKGSSFSVISENGTTEVLGTSFNIYTRGEDYRVYCKTGKVRVATKKDEQIIIPGEIAILNNSKLKKDNAGEEIIFWRSNQFNFESQPFSSVIQEVERQYNVNIESDLDLTYTGNFFKEESVDSTLSLICDPFDLTFVKLGDNNYKVLEN
jgi:hypothetical protein